ncbi:hypothetical protein BU17DRAFT_45345, partial [Hysterangium stoloniferum]
AVCSALQLDYSPLPPRVQRLVTFTDNSNTVAMFNSMKALSPYNRLLYCAIDMLIDS